MENTAKEFKLKGILELGKMSQSELITYIDSLHNILLNYQLAIDQVILKNENVKR